MNSFNRNGNRKRKLSQSIEHEQNSKRENEQSVGCFSSCCKRRKHQIIFYPNNKQKKTSIKKTSNISIPHLSQSSLFNETTFCQKVALANDDPSIQYDVQYESDISENTPKCSRKRSVNNHQIINKQIIDDISEHLSDKEKSTNESKNSFKTSIHLLSHSNSDVVTAELLSNHQSSTNLNTINFDSKSTLKESNLEKSLTMVNDASIDSFSIEIITNGYNWNLPSHETNVDQDKLSEEQEPYNWDDQKYQWILPFDWSEKTSSVNKINEDYTNRSDIIASISLHNSSDQEKTFSRPKSDKTIDEISDDSNESKDRLNVISTTNLFTYAKKQNSLHLNSSSTDHLISPSNRPCRSLSATIANDSKMQIQISPNTILMKNVRNINIEDQIRSKNREISKRHVQSQFNISQENQSSSDEFNNALQHIRSTYNNLINIWWHFLQRFSNFIILSTNTTESNFHSWSTITPTEILNIPQSSDIGPWWSRHDIYDQTPAIFILVNESLNSSYSTEPFFTDPQPRCFNQHQ